jgi:hypothetical protein
VNTARLLGRHVLDLDLLEPADGYDIIETVAAQPG